MRAYDPDQDRAEQDAAREDADAQARAAGWLWERDHPGGKDWEPARQEAS